ncbi:hypothetical protein Hanom_Chr10g00877741 [Helianthus anomalus]
MDQIKLYIFLIIYIFNMVIAGCNHVSEYFGSAAFRKAIQACYLNSDMDLCMKTFENNEDFFFTKADMK